jgi:hypothetical protein
MEYEAPELRELGSFETLTQQELDKVGHQQDFLTLLLPDLTGSIIPDP